MPLALIKLVHRTSKLAAIEELTKIIGEKKKKQETEELIFSVAIFLQQYQQQRLIDFFLITW